MTKITITVETLIPLLAEAIKAVYNDPEPQNGMPTNLFFEQKARTMIRKYPEKILPTIFAYKQLQEDVNVL